MSHEQLKMEWTSKWRTLLNDDAARMSNPEAYRSICHWEIRDMFTAGVIDQLEKLEMDEMVNAAYWHAVEEMLVPIGTFQPAVHYDVVRQADGSFIGQIAQSTFYSKDRIGTADFEGKVVIDEKGARLVFRHGNKAWPMIGMTMTSDLGEIYDLVQTAHFVNGVLYTCVDDPDAYRLLLDSAQLALENHDFDTYRVVRPLLLSARFTKCSECNDNFLMREDCTTCCGHGFIQLARTSSHQIVTERLA